MTDFEPEPGRELLKAYVDNFPNDKAAWEQDRAELLRLGIVEEDVLDQMEVVWGEQVRSSHPVLLKVSAWSILAFAEACFECLPNT